MSSQTFEIQVQDDHLQDAKRRYAVKRRANGALTHFRCRYAMVGDLIRMPAHGTRIVSLVVASGPIDRDVVIERDRILVIARSRSVAVNVPIAANHRGGCTAAMNGGSSTCHRTVARFSCASQFADFAAPCPVVHDAFSRSRCT